MSNCQEIGCSISNQNESSGKCEERKFFGTEKIFEIM